jgi:NADPH:quinone reductase-like Zn-dependent oxidoreductase
MLAMEITQPGPPGVLQPCRRAVPVPQAGEVLIRVVAAGVNRPDCLQRSGSYPPPPGASDLPGLEVAGIVVAVADDVSRPSVGDRVCALVTGGGYAEYCTAPAVQCLPVPAALTLIEAGEGRCNNGGCKIGMVRLFLSKQFCQGSSSIHNELDLGKFDSESLTQKWR